MSTAGPSRCRRRAGAQDATGGRRTQTRPMSVATGTIAAERSPRLAIIDVLKGVAILAMIVYHFAWDLSAYQLIAVDVTSDLGWRIFARPIAGTFLALVGINLVLAARTVSAPAPISGASPSSSSQRSWSRSARGGSSGDLRLLRHPPPDRVASILALPFLRAPLWLTAPRRSSSSPAGAPDEPAFFGAPAGLARAVARPAPTVDYVPVFPWFGVVLVGVIAGRLICDHARGSRFADWRIQARCRARRLRRALEPADLLDPPADPHRHPDLGGAADRPEPRGAHPQPGQEYAWPARPWATTGTPATPTPIAWSPRWRPSRSWTTLRQRIDRKRSRSAGSLHVTACRPKNPPPLIDNQL